MKNLKKALKVMGQYKEVLEEHPTGWGPHGPMRVVVPNEDSYESVENTPCALRIYDPKNETLLHIFNTPTGEGLDALFASGIPWETYKRIDSGRKVEYSLEYQGYRAYLEGYNYPTDRHYSLNPPPEEWEHYVEDLFEGRGISKSAVP